VRSFYYACCFDLRDFAFPPTPFEAYRAACREIRLLLILTLNSNYSVSVYLSRGHSPFYYYSFI